jgi:hypothetical protein
MSYIALATTTLGSAAANVTFSSIPATYKDLIVVYSGSNTTGLAGLRIRLNGDSTSIYSTVNMNGESSGATSSAQTETSANIGVSSTGQSNTIIQIMDYSATDKHKTILGRGNTLSTSFVRASAGRWANTNAVNTVQVSTYAYDFNSGTTISLYGVA